jgi:hypothetical protein
MQDDDLDPLFARLRVAAPVPSQPLLDRVMADAIRAQPQLLPPRLRTVNRRSLLSRLLGQLGGLPVAAGISSAAIMGLVIGYADPTTLDMLTNGMAGYAQDASDLFPDTDFLISEG